MVSAPSTYEDLRDTRYSTKPYGNGECEFVRANVVYNARRPEGLRDEELAVVSSEYRPGLTLNEVQMLKVVTDTRVL